MAVGDSDGRRELLGVDIGPWQAEPYDGKSCASSPRAVAAPRQAASRDCLTAGSTRRSTMAS
jgi:hypothetical protein